MGIGESGKTTALTALSPTDNATENSEEETTGDQNQHVNPGGTPSPATSAPSDDGIASARESGKYTAQKPRPGGSSKSTASNPVTPLHPRSMPTPNGDGVDKDNPELEGPTTDPKASTLSPHLTPAKRPIESSDQLAARLRTRRKERNQERLSKANTSDETIIGESTDSAVLGSRTTEQYDSGKTYLDSRVETFFPRPVVGPNDYFQPPPWFLRALRTIASTPVRTPDKPPFQFESTQEAAAANAKLLASFDYDLGIVIKKFTTTTLGYGSEFRPTEQLRSLIGRHPNFNSLKNVIDNGMEYVFTRELDEATQRNEMLTILSRGNHKSAQELPEQVTKLLNKDVTHGFSIPLPVAIVSLIPNAGIQPLGLASQWTIDEEGERIAKYRLTQDLTFSSNKTGPPVSINSRIDMSAYTEMIFGWCLPRILHFVVALRILHPGLLILIAKYDYSDAYRRIAHSARAATQTIAIQGPLAYLSLRLTFGGSPNPPTWCMFSEIVTDLANEISLCDDWDPTVLHSPAQPTVQLYQFPFENQCQ